LFAAYLALTYYVSSRPWVPGASMVPDVVLHTAEFSVLTVLLVNALSGAVAVRHRAGALWAALLFGVVYAVIDEFHQSFVPGRDASVRDSAVDIAATGLTVLSLGTWSWRRNRKGS
jgi:VanZ family protein